MSTRSDVRPTEDVSTVPAVNAVRRVSLAHPMFGEMAEVRPRGELAGPYVPDPRRHSTAPTHAALRALTERAAALELLDSGVEATALVEAVEATGMSCNRVPVVALSLAVEVPGERARTVLRYAVVPRDDHRSLPMSRIAVLVDPAREDNILLRYDLRPLA